MLYVSLLVTTKQKPTINTQKINRQEYKYIYTTKESHQNKKEESRRRIKEEGGTTKTASKQ